MHSNSVNQTSDFEEEWSIGEPNEDKQIIDVAIKLNGKDLKTISLLVSRQGVSKITSSQLPAQHAKLRKTTVPIQVGKQFLAAGGKSKQSPLDQSATSDLTSSPASSVQSPSSPDGSNSYGFPQSRSISPIIISYLEQKPTLIRQNTFTESSCQTSNSEKAVNKCFDQEIQANVEGLSKQIQTNSDCGEYSNTTSQTEALSVDHFEIQCFLKENSEDKETLTEPEVLKSDTPLEEEMPDEAKGCLTPIVVNLHKINTSNAFIQTDQSPVKTEIITEEFPRMSRTPCTELTFNSTQTDILDLSSSEAQKSKQSSRKSSPRSSQSFERNCTFVKNQTYTDEIVSRVLLEHADVEDAAAFSKVEYNSTEAPAPKSSESDPGFPENPKSPQMFFSADGSNRAYSDTHYKSWNDLMKLPIDISARSVNYMDLSKLGNEGETPNSEEIWVNVEDDNKFLTSDTETYSVATDKVSNTATFCGHASDANAKFSQLIRSVSEAELLELGNESLMSDRDDYQISAHQFAALMRHEMEPVKESLNSTGQTITGIAGTLTNIKNGVDSLCCNITQMKSKVLSTGENEESIFEGKEETIELIKNGKPNGDTDELVDMIMLKLETILKLRDEQLEEAINSLKDDNSFLRKELEVYRGLDVKEGGKNNELEIKMQEVLDNMKMLKDRKMMSSTQSSASSTDIKAENRKRLKKRSRSVTVDKLNNKNKTYVNGTGISSNKYDAESTSEEEVNERNRNFSLNNGKMFPKQVTLVDSQQQTLNIDLLSKEIQTTDLITAEACTFTDMTIREIVHVNEADVIDSEQIYSDIGCSSRKSRGKEKQVFMKEKTLNEVTESMIFHGPGLGAEGGASSPTPKSILIEKKKIKEKSPPEEKVIMEKKSENNSSLTKAAKGKEVKEKDIFKGKSKSVERTDQKKIANEKNGNSLSGNNPNGKNPIKIKQKSTPTSSTNGKPKKSEEKIKKSATDPNLTPSETMISKIIEGDDFKITITSNQELTSCEFSDFEDSSSPRKKIIVTPKTPDKKNPIKEEKKEEVVIKKTGRIPISKQYIKTKNELPAPEQYPAARPPASQIPAPSMPYSSMSPCYPVVFDIPGYNHNIPPTPTQDYSICSNTYPISGRNTRMSMEGEVITMMIKQESRDSNVYDAPSSIPDFYDIRESPDGAFSYVIDGPIRSSMSNISDLKYDCSDDVSSEGVERDVIMEFVMMEEAMERNNFRNKGPSPFKGYAERMRQKVIKEFIQGHKKDDRKLSLKTRIKHQDIPSAPVPVRQNHRRKLWRTRSQSVSTEKLSQLNSSMADARKLVQSKRNCFSTDRLPMLSATEEERIIRIKKYEDATEQINENRRHHNLRKFNRNALKHQPNHIGEIVIYENGKPTSPIDTKNEIHTGKEPDSGIESQWSKESEENTQADSSSDSCKEVKNPRLEPIEKASKRNMSTHSPPLSVECFIVSRGWQIDQAQLTKALSKLDGLNFVRMQVANTMNRVLENIRPNNDVVLVHIGTQEIGEACHCISNEESIAGKFSTSSRSY